MNKASMVITSDTIFTGTTNSLISGGVAVLDDKIVAVGSLPELQSWIGESTQVLDYGNKLIMPGFFDAHMHFFTGAFVNSEYMLTDLFGAKSEEECVSMVKSFADAHPEYEIISGMGWFPAYWGDNNELPSCASLDAVVSDRPVYLLSADCHTFWLNSKALKACRITAESQVSFGEIGKDKDGTPNGLLFEIEACAPANESAFQIEENKMKELQRNFFKEVAKSGITSTTNMSVSPVLEKDFKDYQIASELEEAGELTVRLHLYPSMGLDGNYETVNRLKERFDSPKLQVSGVKHFVDGVTSTYTASLLEPYSDKPQTKGNTNYTQELYENCVLLANQQGISVRLHCIGDGAVNLALDVFEKSNHENAGCLYRNTIEHVESIHPDDLGRFGALDVVASMQPIHLPLDMNEKIERIGKERCRYEWPHKSIIDCGGTLAFGTDFPVANINPFPNIYAAITRKGEDGQIVGVNPQEKISLFEALRAYTYGGAYAVGRERELGTLETGKLADLVVVDRNLFEVKEEEVKEASILLTVMNGEIVYEK